MPSGAFGAPAGSEDARRAGLDDLFEGLEKINARIKRAMKRDRQRVGVLHQLFCAQHVDAAILRQ